jgi:hypothetical protein
VNLAIRPLTQEEQKYTYAQSHQLVMQTGAIGHLRGDFDRSGSGFFTTWFDELPSRNTDVFKAEMDLVINTMRFDDHYGGFLQSRTSMSHYCAEQGSAFTGNYCIEYGVRVDTAQFSFLFRCNPTKGDYNFYCWCFEKPWLDRHIIKASRGIRFIDPMYQEKFRIPDGGMIRVTSKNGSVQDRACRYIDDYHVEVGNSLYHICEYAERLEASGTTIMPLQYALPEKCADESAVQAESSHEAR